MLESTTLAVMPRMYMNIWKIYMNIWKIIYLKCGERDEFIM